MNKCDEDCLPLCDHCQYMVRPNGEGWCNFYGRAQDPCGECEHFFCIVLNREATPVGITAA